MRDDDSLPEAATRGLGASLAVIAIEAGAAILDIYRAGQVAVARKDDASPVTEADHAAEAVILKRLAGAFPHIPVVAEERITAGDMPLHTDRLFLVDPLDGTREFIAGHGEFTVNIALIENGSPVAGVVYAPAFRKEAGWLCFADPVFGAFEADIGDVANATHVPAPEHWRRLQVRMLDEHRVIAMASRSHCDPQTEAFLDRLAPAETVVAGSSLKFCVLACGAADVYPRFSPTMEWDIAAGDAVLRAAGGKVLDEAGTPLVYGRTRGDYTNGAFIAWGGGKAD